MSVLAFLVARETIVATAIVGAGLATAASVPALRARTGEATAGALVKAGYGLTGLSIVLMIVAGFLSGR